MRWFYNMKIASKLILGFLIMAIIAGVVGIVGLTNILSMNKADTLLYEENTLGIKYSSNAMAYYQRLKYNFAEILLLKDDRLIDSYVSNINTFISTVDQNLADYKAGITTEEDRQLYNVVEPEWVEYKGYIQEALGYLQKGLYDRAKKVLLEDADAAGNAIRDSLVRLVEYNEKSADERADANTEITRTSVTLMIAIIAAGVVIALLMGLFISRAISKPIKKIVAAVERLVLGDTEIQQTIFTRDEIGDLANAFQKVIASTREQAEIIQRIADGDLTVDVHIRSEKDLMGQKLAQMVKNLNDLVQGITIAADQVSSGAKQISDSAVQLSQGATEQASSIEELTASIEEVASQTKTNAENAGKANSVAEQTKDLAVAGNARMQEMLSAMDEINQSSNNINKIIKVIDDIAFQTNILALNAAVEAARAGQYGKGFAVVAEEVRNLAAQSANAAKETTALIEDSIRKAGDGTKIAKETAEALGRIVEGVEAVSSLVSGINAASTEQAAAIAQINEGISLVSQVVQANSATSEESAAASEELSSQAEALKKMIGQFRVKRA